MATYDKRHLVRIDASAVKKSIAVDLNGQKVAVSQLGGRSLALIAKELDALIDQLKAKEINWDNYKEPDNIVFIASLLLEKFPHILQEATGIHEEDLAELPLDYIIKLIVAVIDVNLESKDAIENAFVSLAAKFKNEDNVEEMGAESKR